MSFDGMNKSSSKDSSSSSRGSRSGVREFAIGSTASGYLPVQEQIWTQARRTSAAAQKSWQEFVDSVRRARALEHGGGRPGAIGSEDEWILASLDHPRGQRAVQRRLGGHVPHRFRQEVNRILANIQTRCNDLSDLAPDDAAAMKRLCLESRKYLDRLAAAHAAPGKA